MEKELVVVIDFGGTISWSPEESENAMYIARSTLTRQT